MDFVGIRTTFITSTGLKPADFIIMKVKGISKYIADALWEKLPAVMENYAATKVPEQVYAGVKKRTGKLGKSFIPMWRKINQYAMEVGGYWDYTTAPHMATHMQSGPPAIFPDTKKWLTIPVKGGEADVYPRKSVLSWGDAVKFVPLTPFLAMWVLAGKENREKGKSGARYKTVLFWGRKSVSTPRELDNEAINKYLTDYIDERAIAIASQAVDTYQGGD
jgi:hypothetical protein